jgi:hypothetical protein
VNRDATIRAGARGRLRDSAARSRRRPWSQADRAAEMSAHALFDLNQRIRPGERPAIAGTAEPCTKVRSA